MRLLSYKLDSDRKLSKHFMPHQIAWIQAEKPIHEQRKQAMALAEKSVRIGWTYADAFKNVRKRLWFKNRDYLFATKDYQSALEYVEQCYKFAEIFNLTHAITRHGEESIQVHSLDEQGRPSAFTQDVKVGMIKFDNGSRIIAFSANPQAMAVYGGDVGLDEFAKHPNPRLLWETAQGRITWGYDLAIWSAHDGEDTLFNEFALEARSVCASPLSGIGGKDQGEVAFSTLSQPLEEGSTVRDPSSLSTNSKLLSPWNLYFRVTLADAIKFGLVDVINRARGTKFTAEQFLADSRDRARLEEVFEQSYMCNPAGAASNHIVDWSAIERCRYDYEIIRIHFEQSQIIEQFGQFNPGRAAAREQDIADFIHKKFLPLFQGVPLTHWTGEGSRVRASSTLSSQPSTSNYRLGFDVAASGEGDLAVIYIDELNGEDLWLSALFTCRTEDWSFIRTVLFTFLRELRSVRAAGDESGLGRQICWEARQHFVGWFSAINFSSSKQDLGFALMNQLSTAQKRFPRAEQDIAADYFALRKSHQGSRWIFSEAANHLNAASHCDIAWAGALATHAHLENRGEEPWALLG